MKHTEFNYHGRRPWLVAGWMVWVLLVPLWLVGILSMIRYDRLADATEQKLKLLQSESDPKMAAEGIR